MNRPDVADEVKRLVEDFDRRREENQEVATDQILNAVFLTVTLKDAEERSFDMAELQSLRENLLRQISWSPA